VMPFAELCGHPFREADPGTQSGKVRSYAVGSPSIVWREARSSKKSAPPGGPIHASGKSGGPDSTFAFRPLAEFNPGRRGGCDDIEVLLNCGQSRLYNLGIQGLIPGAIAWTVEIDLTGLQVSVRNRSGLRIALESAERMRLRRPSWPSGPAAPTSLSRQARHTHASRVELHERDDVSVVTCQPVHVNRFKIDVVH
jgi:hypothetical protein